MGFRCEPGYYYLLKKEMYLHTQTEWLNLLMNIRCLLVIFRDDEFRYHVQEIIQEQMPEAEFIVVPHIQRKDNMIRNSIGKRFIYKYVRNM